MSTMLDHALVWFDHGYTPLPVMPDGSKRPAVRSWAHWQDSPPDRAEVERMFKTVDHDGFGVLTGQRGLEMLELEGRAIAEGMATLLAYTFAELGLLDLWSKIAQGLSERTPSGGMHWYLRVIDGPAHGNVKLARRPATADELAAAPDDRVKTLIETRGRGGFTIVAPSGGRTHSTGAEWYSMIGSVITIPEVTMIERDLIYEVCRSLDQMPTEVPAGFHDQESSRKVDHETRPGDDFNARADWTDILTPHGWTLARTFRDRYRTWAKPGKSSPGISATTGRNDDDRLWVFSTATDFEPEKPYDKFGAYALLEHGGDLGAAARELRSKGYGGDRSTGEALPALTLGEPSIMLETGERVDPSTGEILADDRERPAAAVDHEFWGRRAILEHVRTYAYSQMVSPWAVLGVVMLRALQTVPPWATLPAIVGGRGSLNAYLCLVGPPGAGKGAAEAVGAQAVIVNQPVYSIIAGSGEGLLRTFAHWDLKAKEQVIDRTAALITSPEIDQLRALDQRQGSTLMPLLRDAYNGAALGFAYANDQKRLKIEAHTYRLGFLLGVQPERADWLMAGADGGTPQRFWWLPATDPAMPDHAEPPPEPIKLPEFRWPRADLGIPDTVRHEVRATRLRQVRGELGALDGQGMLARLKAAVALTVIDGRSIMTEDDWRLSAIFMARSDATRTLVIETLAGRDRARASARHRSAAEGAMVIDETRIERRAQRCMVRLRRYLDLAGGQATRHALGQRFKGDDRLGFNDAVDRLEAAGELKIERRGKSDWLSWTAK